MIKMAEKKHDNLAKKLDKDLDEHIQKVYEKNKDYKYQDGLTEENLEEQIRLIPAFSNKVPTQEDIDASPALQALQALKYEEDDPHACAMSHKEDGNYNFQKKKYKLAIKAYTEGLKMKHEDATLYAVLYTNRAAANFYIGNNRSALNDATSAWKHKPDHMKAIIRGAICCFDLERYDECMEWCESGLKIDGKEKKLIELKKKSAHQKKQKDRDRRKAEMREVKDLTIRNNLLDAFQSRDIALEHMDTDLNKRKNYEQLLINKKIYLDENKRLHWPVYFLYPESNQSDFIEDYNEDIRFIDQMTIVFNTLPTWDTKKEYKLENIQIYFEDRDRSILVHIDPKLTLRNVLSDKRFRLESGSPAFMVLSNKTKFFEETFKKQKAEKFV